MTPNAAPIAPLELVTAITHQAAREVYQRISANIAKIMQGQAGSTRKLLAALASGGHRAAGGFPGHRQDHAGQGAGALG